GIRRRAGDASGTVRGVMEPEQEETLRQYAHGVRGGWRPASREFRELLALPPIFLLLPLLMDGLLEQVGYQARQPDRRIDEALGHLRVLVELPPRLALLEGAAAEASPLRHVDRDLGRVHV